VLGLRALEYCQQGYSVIPCHPRDKRPLVAWKDYQDQCASTEQVAQWWLDWPNANIALVMGRGVFAVDVDGLEGHEALEREGIDLSEYPKCSSGRGVHYYCKGEAPDRIGVLPKVDIRGKGIMIAPPSVHPNGSEYTWLIGLEYLMEAPEKLLSLIRRSQTIHVEDTYKPDWLVDALKGVGEGQRNATCTRIAGYYLGKGMPKEAVLESLYGWGLRCTPPIQRSEIQTIVDSISAREGEHKDEVILPEPIAEILPKAIAQIHTRVSKPIATNLAWLDDMLDGGIYQSDYIILGSRPGIGKTALALQLAQAAAFAGNGTLIISREMSRSSLVRRMLCQKSQIPLSKLKTGDLASEERECLGKASESLASMPIWISSDKTIVQVRKTVESFSPGALGLVIVDYLQLVRSPQHKSLESRQAVEHVSQELRDIANNYAPVLCLSSLSRPPRDVRDYTPGLGDLRESGELEHDADIVWLMWREAGNPVCSFAVQKNREGRVGQHRFTFHGDILTFTD